MVDSFLEQQDFNDLLILVSIVIITAVAEIITAPRIEKMLEGSSSLWVCKTKLNIVPEVLIMAT